MISVRSLGRYRKEVKAGARQGSFDGQTSGERVYGRKFSIQLKNVL